MINECFLDHIYRLIQLLGEDEADAVFAAQMLILYADASVTALISALSDGEVEVRRKAVWPLLTINNPLAVDAFIDALQHDPDAKVRRYAAHALGELKAEKAVISLVWAFGDEDERVRWDSAVALAKIGAPAVEHLVAALQYAGERVRLGAVTALGWMRDVRVVGWLRDALGDSDAVVRTRAAFALGWIADPRSVKPLIAALHDLDYEVRMQAAVALGWLRDPRAVEPLVALLGDEATDELVSKAATEALCHIGGDKAVKALAFASRYSSSRPVRQESRSTLRRMGFDPDKIELDLSVKPIEVLSWGQPIRRCNLVITSKV